MLQKYELFNGKIRETQDDDAPILVFANPDENEKNIIINTYLIDEHNLQSALDPNEVSRMEFEDEYTAVIYKKPKNYSSTDQYTFKAFTVGVFYFKNRIIIVMGEDIVLFEEKYFIRLVTLPDVLLRLLSEAINHFMMHLRVISMITDELETKITRAMENKHLLNLFSISKSLVYYLNAIESNTTIIAKMKRNPQKLDYEENQIDFLEDIAIENYQCYRQAEIYSTVLGGLMDARGTIVNNNMNVLIKQLTIINIIFMPINVIASVGGMSEFSMMTTGLDWRISYALFMIAMVMIGWVTYMVIKRMENKTILQQKRRVRYKK